MGGQVHARFIEFGGCANAVLECATWTTAQAYGTVGRQWFWIEVKMIVGKQCLGCSQRGGHGALQSPVDSASGPCA